MSFRRLVEEWLPLARVNRSSEVEQGFIRVPKLSNLHPWPARRPYANARALTLASILPEGFSRDLFNWMLGLDRVDDVPYKILYLVQPDRDLVADVIRRVLGKSPEDVVVVDPMAGGGSIPLEALRLGFKTIAIEYNPVAYLILKATLEYPAKYGMRLYEEVRAEARRLINWAKEELRKYYPEDAINYIIARGYKCPSCGGLIPIIHGTRLGENGPWIKLDFDKKAKTFKVSISSVETRFIRLRCPYCSTPVVKDIALRDWVLRHKRLLETALSGNIQEAKNSIDELIQTHILLVKQTKRGFKPAGKEDVDRLIDAYLDLTRLAAELREFIPSSSISEKENEVFKPLIDIGIRYWYQLFNPRQLLVLVKLVKYIRTRIKYLIDKKRNLGAIISVYLVLGIDKFADFNTITGYWAWSVGAIRPFKEHYASKRQIDLHLEYCEMPPIVEDPKKSLGWVFEPDIKKPTATRGGVCPVVRHLCSWINGLGDRVRVFMADARRLSELLSEGTVDIINVDPPYFDQHIYSDISEFFWQILRIALAPAIDAGYLFSRDELEKAELFVLGWSPMLPTVPRDAEIIERKTIKTAIKGKSIVKIVERMKIPHTRDWYIREIWRFFCEAYKTLKDDGVLIVWFTHSDPEAWEGILSALYASGFTVTKVWTIKTEQRTRPVARAGLAFCSSLAIIARKAADRVIVGTTKPEELIANEEVKQVIVSSTVDALQSAIESGASEQEKYIMALAGAIAGATRVWNPLIESATPRREPTLRAFIKPAKELETTELMRFVRLSQFFRNSLYPVAIYHGISRLLEGMAREVLSKTGLEKTVIEDMVRDIMLVDRDSKAYLLLWASSRYAKGPTIEY
ncbi:MAG: hypothetical protein DRN91_08860, partial [Candidatus Alkanophagales archaeon]